MFFHLSQIKLQVYKIITEFGVEEVLNHKKVRIEFIIIFGKDFHHKTKSAQD
jgi:hypothetical protein